MKQAHLIPILAMLLAPLTANSIEIHDHVSKDIGANTPVPKIEIHIFKDTMDGVNLHVAVENYSLDAPDNVTNKSDLTDDGVLQGHAHVFVNATKFSRLYGNDMHIPASALKEGVNQIAVSLNSHNHENWVKDNQDIVSSVFFDLSKDPIILHNFTSQPLEHTYMHHSGH
ncbi:hypothetical protein [Alteromonas sp. C1M14]|uniref:hypothetical protein n=1 Tax=Alteromonas sp. C1M14 TaxID=2841567 RepID=UPI001C08A29C|nr:hypothetical protein [Alteromonas sp. C1M14]MBU2979579.1 hypothetical protein [Alteromonas sp. C1M14]